MNQDATSRRLAADVVGYNRLMGTDETGTLARIKALRREVIDPSIAAHGGTIFKTTGDGIFVEFSSAMNAVEHAVEVQHEIAARNAGVPDDRRIEFRIGINVGDAIADGGDIFGDGVNIASRLEVLSETGGVRIAGNVYDQVKNKTECAFEDMGLQQVKNIENPVHTYRVVLHGSEAGSGSDASAVLVLSRPALAVFPFSNLTGDPEQEYFADGLTEDIITALSAWRAFPVIARNSSFIYKGKSVKVQQVADELGVRYVLEGSVRKGGNRLRITAQLIDAKNGTSCLGGTIRPRARRYLRAAGRDHRVNRRDRRARAGIGGAEAGCHQEDGESGCLGMLPARHGSPRRIHQAHDRKGPRNVHPGHRARPQFQPGLYRAGLQPPPRFLPGVYRGPCGIPK